MMITPGQGHAWLPQYGTLLGWTSSDSVATKTEFALRQAPKPTTPDLRPYACAYPWHSSDTDDAPILTTFTRSQACYADVATLATLATLTALQDVRH